MNRQSRSGLARQTLRILEEGYYQLANGSEVSIAEPLAASCAQTLLYRPDQYADLLQTLAARPASESTILSVSNQTTLEAGRNLTQKYAKVTCLNFASAKNPGGGFLGGSQAQEESLARSSALYATLQTQPAYYEYHRRGGSCLYSHHAIYSPGVPIFRDDSGHLLTTPWQCDFLTAPAVNAGAVLDNEPENGSLIVSTMEERTRMVLAIAALQGCEAFVLGAWGCGVFRNEPATIADIFVRVLEEELFHNRFKHLEFAVYDPQGTNGNYRAFVERLT